MIKALEYVVRFRNNPGREQYINNFLEKVMNRIYIDGKCFDDGADFDNWMNAGIEIPIIALKYKVVIGYYDTMRGTTCIATPTDKNELNVEFSYDIKSPLIPNSMLVYNGVDHFGYLSTRKTSTLMNKKDNSTCKVNKNEIVSPLDEAFYDLFEPDYTSCELFIRSIGFDIDSSRLIGHRLLLHRSRVKDKKDSWMRMQLKLYDEIWVECLNKAQSRINNKKGRKKGKCKKKNKN